MTNIPDEIIMLCIQLLQLVWLLCSSYILGPCEAVNPVALFGSAKI